MKIPKRLPLERSCFHRLPAGLTQKELVEHELYARQQYGQLFHSRSESFYFFELPTPAIRDAFLRSLEISCLEAGYRIKRETIYPTTHEQTVRYPATKAQTRSRSEDLRRLGHTAPDEDISVADPAPDSTNGPTTRRNPRRSQPTASARSPCPLN